MMTRRELNQYNMQETLATFLNRNLDKIKDYPAIVSGVHKLSAYNFDIYALTHTQLNSESFGENAARIKQMFQSCRVLLNDYLDLLMLPFKITNPEFYNEYKNARVITDQSVSLSMETVAV